MATVGVISTAAPARPQRTSPEVIDVDAFEEDEVLFLGCGSSQSRPPVEPGRSASVSSVGLSTQPILIVDSDEEQAPPRANRRRLISPPPRPVFGRFTPPVPPLPAQFAGQQSFPTGARNNRPHPPIVRPNAQPFAFEASLRQTPRRVPTPVDLMPAAAPRSNHQPAMGFGGALIAMNRQNAIAEANRQREEEERFHRQLPERGAGMRRFLPAFVELWQSRIWGTAEHDNADSWLLNADPIHNILAEEAPGLVFGFGTFGSRSSATEQYYKTIYTHAEKAQAGFTHDFAPAEGIPPSSQSSSTVIVLEDDDASEGGKGSVVASSSSVIETSTTLVCARCMDPLVLPAAGATTDEERKTRKIWALRCGHMLDGKCVEELMCPTPEQSNIVAEPELPADPQGKGKGKVVERARAIDAERATSSQSSGKGKGKGKAPASTDRKGKGKATESPQIETPMPGAFPESPVKHETESTDDSIRSRLRPRHPRGPAEPGSSTTAESSSSAFPPLSTRPVRSLPRRRSTPAPAPMRSRAKGKGRARNKPLIEAQYEWECPVVGCARVHASVFIDGEWKMEEERGAIAVFV
ncbi:uncharacterized protein LAESUDRAFT_736232 [Laetiporus sulphureus 93-53]|uniref:Uncharacterized protein n=1 Tax=Laetiporus sulphureus 93-53 TaxID=1314785 RepID=A0A165ERC5_9APHY|nr:uncharacterized protein LAESUDRAFT_736232 [Laetiporus sulphureus 93-53]KZT07604.1 hypothetical protein LAESUDRAFT_736232 [Laetiporus sulphureus 93-53]